MDHMCIECGQPSIIGLGNADTKWYCKDHAPGLVDLNEMMSELGREEKRIFLQKFYTGAYYNDMYNPHNGYFGWKWIIETNNLPFDKALDVGCGTGEGIRWAVDKGYDVWGIDFADAREAWKKWGVSERCQIASALDIPYPDESFDLVVCMDVLEHIPEEDALDALKEMRRVGSVAYIFAIALTLEKEPVGKKVLSHITVKSADWWINKFIEAGYGVAQTKSGKPALQFDDDHIRAFLTKDC